MTLSSTGRLHDRLGPQGGCSNEHKLLNPIDALDSLSVGLGMDNVSTATFIEKFM